MMMDWRKADMKGIYKRPEVKQITKEWVYNNCNNITERDMGLLRLLADKRVLKRDQIQRLYPEFASTERLNSRLKVLFNKHVIDRIVPPVPLGQGSAQQHICIDRAGIILLDIERYSKPIKYDSSGQRTLVDGFHHRVAINECECLIQEVLRELEGEMIYYETEEKCHFNDSYIKPDIVCIFKCKGKGYGFCIEVDMGTERLPVIKNKIDNYKDYYVSKQWAKKEWARVFKNPTFPRVLLLTKNGFTKRVNEMRHYTHGSMVRFLSGTHEDFTSIINSILKGSL
jgi:hypothetical protein